MVDKVPKVLRAIIVLLHKSKGVKGNYKNYKGISLLSIVGKIYPDILLERVYLVTEELAG